jgi:hypothetical protein
MDRTHITDIEVAIDFWRDDSERAAQGPAGI